MSRFIIGIVLVVILLLPSCYAATVYVTAAEGSSVYINCIEKGKIPGNRCNAVGTIAVNDVPLNKPIWIGARRLADNGNPINPFECGCKASLVYSGKIQKTLKKNWDTVRVPQGCHFLPWKLC
jgi:hypothetical protein